MTTKSKNLVADSVTKQPRKTFKYRSQFLWYTYKRQSWMLDPSRYLSQFGNVKIDRPIFLLGTHGGGLTLTSRVLRRNPAVVSVSGNHKYWTGADEMYNVYRPLLPPTLTVKHAQMPHAKMFPAPRGWSYATDPLLPFYRSTASDVTPEIKHKFEHILRWTIARHSNGQDSARFIDKSQLYTIKLGYLNEMLREAGPRFILIVRDPFAICYRVVEKMASLREMPPEYTFEERLEFASQHWANSMQAALDDGKNAEHFMVLKFEDIVQQPRQYMQQICDFAELDLSDDMLPQPHHRIPFGTRLSDRWHPIRPYINTNYLEKLTPSYAGIIDRYCGKLAETFGYDRP